MVIDYKLCLTVMCFLENGKRSNLANFFVTNNLIHRIMTAAQVRIIMTACLKLKEQ
jgi:hypothetical protein